MVTSADRFQLTGQAQSQRKPRGCEDLQADGTVGKRLEEQAFLFDFEKDGTPYTTTVPDRRLPFGILEVYNQLQLVPRENLLQIAIEHASAAATKRAKRAAGWRISN